MSSSLLQSSSEEWAELPFLLRLMDDPSPRVRDKIAARLGEGGEEVWRQIEKQDLSITPAQRHALREILARRSQATGHSEGEGEWLDWLRVAGETQRLEAGLAWLCERNNAGAGLKMRSELDRLARQYLASGGAPDPEELGTFLFGENGLKGVPANTPYEAQHSDLLSVLTHGQGLPISLCCIFILVGARLDITVYGCAFPGHFLARAPLSPGESSEDDLVFDPYRGGSAMKPEEVRVLRKAAPREMNTPATAREIIARVLRNMANAHFQNHETEPTRDVLTLLATLENASEAG